MSVGFVLISIPLLVLGILIAVDVVKRQDLGFAGKVAWIACIALIWPTMTGYLLVRPVSARLQEAALATDDSPRSRLATAYAHEAAGVITPRQRAHVAESLR